MLKLLVDIVSHHNPDVESKLVKFQVTNPGKKADVLELIGYEANNGKLFLFQNYKQFNFALKISPGESIEIHNAIIPSLLDIKRFFIVNNKNKVKYNTKSNQKAFSLKLLEEAKYSSLKDKIGKNFDHESEMGIKKEILENVLSKNVVKYRASPRDYEVELLSHLWYMNANGLASIEIEFGTEQDK